MRLTTENDVSGPHRRSFSEPFSFDFFPTISEITGTDELLFNGELDKDEKLASKRNKPRFSFSAAATQIKNLIAPDFETRKHEFEKLFKFKEDEAFIADYSCAFQREILVHGRMYVSKNWLSFHANIFSWETRLMINFNDVTNIAKKKTVKLIPNAIQVSTREGSKLFFTSFTARAKAFLVLNKVWKSHMANKEIDIDSLRLLVDRNNVIDAIPNIKHTGEKRAQSDELKVVKRKKPVRSNTVPPFKMIKADNSQSASSSSYSVSSLSSESSLEDSYSDNVFETTCSCQSHFGAEMFNEVLPASIDDLFSMIFEDNQTSLEFRQIRGFKEYRIVKDWTQDKSGKKSSRTVSYSTSLNYAIGPKSCGVVEKQQMSRKHREILVVCECHNVGIPYGDIFDISLTYCMTRVSENTSRLCGFGGVIYRKSCWAFLKTILEKTAFAAINVHFSDLKKHVKLQCERKNAGKRLSIDLFQSCSSLYELLNPAKLRSRKSRITRESRRDSDLKQKKPVSLSCISIKALLITCIVLLILNIFMYANLWTLYRDSSDGNVAEKSSLDDAFNFLRTSAKFRTEYLTNITRIYSSLDGMKKLLFEIKTRSRI